MTTVNFEVMSNHKDIVRGITSIRTRGANLDLLIWRVAASTVLHSVEHNEASLLDRLYNSMPNGSRRERLAAWILDNSDVVLYKGKAEGRVFAVRANATCNTEALLNNAWYDHARDLEEDKPAWDFQAALERFTKRALKEAEQGNASIDSELLQQLAIKVQGNV